MLSTRGCEHTLCMSERSKAAERLLAHAVVCQKAASLCWIEDIATELKQLADECRRAALNLTDEVPSLWKH